jgi:predicted acetyltransferase
MHMMTFYDPGKLIDHELQLVLSQRFQGDEARNWVPSYRFNMKLAGQNEEIGNIELRIGNTDYIHLYAGHIGYRVHPPFRGHRYAARSCRLLIPLARKHGFRTVWITCNPDNYGSRRTCELAGAKFIEIVDLLPDMDMYREGERQKCRYRLDV